MIIVGELINSSLGIVKKAIDDRNINYIIDLAEKQFKAGVDYIDVNAGTTEFEEDNLVWLVEIIQEKFDIPLCLDSTNEKALSRALEKHKGKAMVNSVSLEKGRMKNIISLVKEYDASVVALCMSDEGIPTTSEDRLSLAVKIAEIVDSMGINMENVYFDPLVLPVSVNYKYGEIFLKTLNGINTKIPNAGTICGLSNISHGLPATRLLNETFLVLALGFGLKAAIVNPLDKVLMSFIRTGELLIGKDRYCRKFLKDYKQNKIVENSLSQSKIN